MKSIKTIGFFIIFLLAIQLASASLQMDNVQFDPAIISAGDEVDIIIQYHDTVRLDDEDRISNVEYKFDVKLESDSSLTDEYVIIQDSIGDNTRSHVLAGEYYNKVFNIKIGSNAPSGNYKFKLVGQWYENGVEAGIIRERSFTMPVKKEGIVIDIASVTTQPGEVRSGDDFVKLMASIENVGEKDAKAIEVNLELPEEFESSYSNNNRIWVGQLKASESKDMTFFIDVKDIAKAGLYELTYNFEYMDDNNNKYTKITKLPFLIKSHPFLEISKVQGEGLSGDVSKLYVTVKNTGTESAESVDVRILKENSQPFEFDVRSDYIGELEPGEEGVAIFDINVNSDAQMKEYDFKLLIRAKGDSDEGDDNIYTFNRRAKFDVTGQAPNKLRTVGLISAFAVILLYIANRMFKKKGKRK